MDTLKKHPIRALSILLVTVIFVIVIFAGVRLATPYRATDEAQTKLASSNNVTVEDLAGFIRFAPADTTTNAGVIIYPGGLVEPESYAPLAFSLAERGYNTFIVRVPFNLAVLEPAKAQQVIDAYPGFSNWIVGGHSLGGSMAAQFADNNSDVNAVFFLASYPPDNIDLTDDDLEVISIYGDKDTVLNLDGIENTKDQLPDDTEYVLLEGANHAQFGSYGMQEGDTQASISPDTQLERTLDSLEMFLFELLMSN